MKGYKIFNAQLQCRDFQYEVGETYIIDGVIELCNHGFHFCKNPSNLFNYYSFDSRNRVCEIEIPDDSIVICDETKCVTNTIIIGKELMWGEVLILVNSGNYNSGYRNSGNHNSGYYNSGYHNSGYYNSGNHNSGYYNSGNHNSGYYNSGNHNSGYYNSGYYNSGNHNSGNHNSGNYNSGNYNSGIFNSTTPKLCIFNQQSDITWDDIFSNPELQFVRAILDAPLRLTEWLVFNDMSDAQKTVYASCEKQGGILLEYSYKDACAQWWEKIDDGIKKQFVKWEYFNAVVFEEITGIKI